MGIWPSILLCRSQDEIPEGICSKIAMFCNLEPENVIAAIDVDSIYKVPLYFKEKGVDKIVCNHFGIKSDETEKLSTKNMQPWNSFITKLDQTKHQVNIGIVGKYTSLSDAYKSINEALCHGSVANGVEVKIHFVDAQEIEDLFLVADDDSFISAADKYLANFDGIIVPGGYGVRGVNGKMAAIRYARLKEIPFLGICYGMQLSIIEFARNVLGIDNAGDYRAYCQRR